MHMRQFFFSLTLLSLALFCSLTFFLYRGRMTKVDFDLLAKLQYRVPKRFDDNLAVVVDFGAMEIQAIVIGVVLIALPLPKKAKMFLATLYITGLLVTLAGKTYLPHPAPPYMFQRGNQGLSFPGLHVQVDSSYPSGHTYRVVFLAAALAFTWILQKKKSLWLTILTIGTSGFAGIVILGLLVLGKHWTSDVIGGATLAIFAVSSVFLIH